MQVLFLFAGIGALMAPVITRPFLLPSEEEKTAINVNSSMADYEQSIVLKNVYTPDDVMVHSAFVICGLIGVIISIPLMYFYLNDRRQIRETQIESKDQSDDQNDQNDDKKMNQGLETYVVVALVAIVGHSVYSLETVISKLTSNYFTIIMTC